MKKILLSILIVLYSISSIWSAEIDSTLFNKSFEEISSIGLPVVMIETENGVFPTFDIAEKSDPDIMWGKGIINADKVPGKITLYKGGNLLYDSGEYVEGESGMTIKVRGNVSAIDHEKKPYKLKLQKKADLLFRGGQDADYTDKNWLLIKDNNINANIGFKINELMEMQWTPSYCYVNVMFNGRYNGVYMLCESVRRNQDCRLNVSKTGYVFEWDTYWWNSHKYVESLIFQKGSPLKYTFKYPDEDDITDDQLDYIENAIAKAEASLNDGTYPDYIDVESFASWILAHDILGTWDAAGSNYFLTKYDNTENSKIMMANLWDLETNFRRVNQWSTAHLAGWFFYESLFNNENETFLRSYKDKWMKVSPTIFDEIIDCIHQFEDSSEGKDLERSIILDNQLWGTSWKTVKEACSDAIDWFADRKVWMSEQMDKIHLKTHISETNFHNDDIISSSDFFSIQGVRLNKDYSRPGIYIKNRNKILISK